MINIDQWLTMIPLAVDAGNLSLDSYRRTTKALVAELVRVRIKAAEIEKTRDYQYAQQVASEILDDKPLAAVLS